MSDGLFIIDGKPVTTHELFTATITTGVGIRGGLAYVYDITTVEGGDYESTHTAAVERARAKIAEIPAVTYATITMAKQTVVHRG